MTTPTKTVDLDRMAAVLKEAGFDSDVYRSESLDSISVYDGNFLVSMRVYSDGEVRPTSGDVMEPKRWNAITAVRDELIRQGVIEE